MSGPTTRHSHRSTHGLNGVTGLVVGRDQVGAVEKRGRMGWGEIAKWTPNHRIESPKFPVPSSWFLVPVAGQPGVKKEILGTYKGSLIYILFI